MFKSVSSTKSKETLLALLLGGVALLATFIAQTSANACITFMFEQPKLPASLIKKD